MILQVIFEQLICGYNAKKITAGLYYIPTQKLYIEVKTDKYGKVNHLSLSIDTYSEKEKEHGKRKERITKSRNQRLCKKGYN